MDTTWPLKIADAPCTFDAGKFVTTAGLPAAVVNERDGCAHVAPAEFEANAAK
jgi:hypothetical protein